MQNVAKIHSLTDGCSQYGQTKRIFTRKSNENTSSKTDGSAKQAHVTRRLSFEMTFKQICNRISQCYFDAQVAKSFERVVQSYTAISLRMYEIPLSKQQSRLQTEVSEVKKVFENFEDKKQHEKRRERIVSEL